MTVDQSFADALVPLAAELVGTIRDYGPDDVAAVLARVPDGRHDALAVVLAAMVDPDARPSELLAWTDCGPVISRGESPEPEPRPQGIGSRGPVPAPIQHGTEYGYKQHKKRGVPIPAGDSCGCLRATRLARAERAERRARVAS